MSPTAQEKYTTRIIARCDDGLVARIDQCVAAARMFNPAVDRSAFIRTALEQAMTATTKAAREGSRGTL
jgi:hypothetical protein